MEAPAPRDLRRQEDHGMAARETTGQNQPFVSGEDRPAVAFSLDTPVSEMRVRDLLTLLGGQAVSTKLRKAEKAELGLKAEKSEKVEHLKAELGKLEHGEAVVKGADGLPPPVRPPTDARLDELVRSVAQLQQEIDDLKAKVADS
jgi:FtsZ-binding cell division protein ZapB